MGTSASNLTSNERKQVYTPVEQDRIAFYGHELVAVVLEDGTICAVLRWLCEGLNLDANGQLQRIQRKTALREGLLPVLVDTAGGPQEMPALTLDVLPGYLFTIDENRVKPEARDDVVLFQRECVKALAAYFRSKRAGGPPLPVGPQLPRSAIVESVPSFSPYDAQRSAQIGEVAEQIVQLTGVIGFLREHLQALLTLPGQVEAIATQLAQALTLLETLAGRQETTATVVATTQAQLAAVDQRTKGLTPAHKRAIIDQVQELVALTRQQSTPLTYAKIYGPLNRRFHAAGYAEIPDERFEEAMGFLRELLRRETDGEAPEQGMLF